MHRRAARQSEIGRVYRAAKANGMAIGGIEVDGTRIRIFAKDEIKEASNDDDLDRELAEFEKRHGKN